MEKGAAFSSTYEGQLMAMFPKKYSLQVILLCNNTPVEFELFDTHIKQFPKLFQKGDIIKGKCVLNLIRQTGKPYNKIITYDLVKPNPISSWLKKTLIKDYLTRKEGNKISSETNKETGSVILTGVITNINNTRVKHNKNEVSFCFKPTGEKRVRFILANEILNKSSFFKKGQKVNIEAVDEKFETSFSNDTLRMINMWSC